MVLAYGPGLWSSGANLNAQREIWKMLIQNTDITSDLLYQKVTTEKQLAVLQGASL